jgi:hypothetical protein
MLTKMDSTQLALTLLDFAEGSDIFTLEANTEYGSESGYRRGKMMDSATVRIKLQ